MKIGLFFILRTIKILLIILVRLAQLELATIRVLNLFLGILFHVVEDMYWILSHSHHPYL